MNKFRVLIYIARGDGGGGCLRENKIGIGAIAKIIRVVKLVKRNACAT